MLRTTLLIALVALPLAPLTAQETPPSIVASYEALADTILAVRDAESSLVRAMLDGHRREAMNAKANGDWQKCAAQIALFANEGDNAIGGVRKRLLEGGHFYNADGVEKGIYDQGYVVVTREAKKNLLSVATEMRRASSDAKKEELWNAFIQTADKLLKTD